MCRRWRPLVGPLDPSAESELVPEIEEDNFAAVVAEPEALAVLVLSLDVRRHLAHEEVAELDRSAWLAPALAVGQGPYDYLAFALNPFFRGRAVGTGGPGNASDGQRFHRQDAGGTVSGVGKDLVVDRHRETGG